MPNEASSQLQRSTLLALTKSPAIDGGQRREAFEEICRAASDGLQAARVSIWSYDAEREAIVCEELYERNEHRHSSGLVLYRKDFPAYFDYIHEQRVLAADDAHTDPATSCFSASYLTPLGISSMLDAPIRRGGRPWGVICHEHVGPKRSWSVGEQLFGASMGDFVAHALAAEERTGAQLELAKLNDELEQRIAVRTAELSHAHGELLKAKQHAENASRAKSEFLANMSHEIRTPMNAILGFSHLALGLEMGPRHREYLEKIATAGESLLSIINDILDFSKIEAGKLDVEAVPIMIQEVLHNVADLLRHQAAEKGLEFIVEPACDLPSGLVGDPLRLNQVLVNLTNNAIKFTERGQVLVRVGVEQRDECSVILRFSVQDSGIGMTASQVSGLFQPFTQADSSMTRRYGGTGLGLAISKRLVELMGGQLWVVSEKGLGSTFHFTCRFGLDGFTESDPPRVSATLEGVRVLVVDDNLVARETLVEQLRVFRFDTHSVDSGAAAIAELSAATTDRAYDLVLMPGLDGIETIRRIRSSTSIPCPAFVIMSNGSDGEEVLAEAKQNGVEGIVLNPVTPSLLLDTVCNALGHESFARRRHRTEAPMSTPHGEPLRGARVLLVEDNEINRVLAIELLRQVGTEVVEASNGRDALVELAQSTFDAVLMDIQMPEMNGWQATERIRENPNHRTLPIIALSAHCMAGFGEECLQGGMNDYLSKPIDADELYRMLRRWIPRKTAADMVDPENV